MRRPLALTTTIALLLVGYAAAPAAPAAPAPAAPAPAGSPVAADRLPRDLPPPGFVAMRYVRMGNTGVQGDTSEALWVGPDGNPWIGGYDPTFEEGGLAQYRIAEDRFAQVSNVDRPVLGSPSRLRSSRVHDITGDERGRVWFSTSLGIFSMSPVAGRRSVRRYRLTGPGGDGGASDLDVSPDGLVWAVDEFVGRVGRLDPATGRTTTWVQNARQVAVQPGPGDSYSVWTGTSADSAAPLNRYDSVTRTWTTVDTGGAHVYWLGPDPVDERGRLYAVRAVGPDEQGITTYAFGWYGPDLAWHDLALWPGAGAEFVHRLRGYGDGGLLVAYADGHVWQRVGGAWSDLGLGGPANTGLGIQGLDLDRATGKVWTSGPGGTLFRDVKKGRWHRLRITNSSMGDNFALDLDVAQGKVYVTQNVSSDVGGWAVWDGVRWKNNTQLNHGWKGTTGFPFPTANTNAIHRRSSNGRLAMALTGGGAVEWTGSRYVDLQLADWEATSLVEDGAGRLWAGDNSMLIGYRESGVWHNFFEAGAPLFATDPVADPDHPRRVWATGADGTVWTDGVDHHWLKLSGRWVVPIGDRRAWVGGNDGLYRVDMATGTWRRFGPAVVRKAETGPIGISPDGLLWYSCDGDLCWLDTGTIGAAKPRTGIFHVDIEPQWGRLPWHPTDGDIRPLRHGYQLWLTTPSRGLTVIGVRTG